MSGLTKAATVRAEWHVVSDLGTRMVELAETSGDQLGLAAGLFALGNADMFRGELSRTPRSGSRRRSPSPARSGSPPATSPRSG